MGDNSPTAHFSSPLSPQLYSPTSPSLREFHLQSNISFAQSLSHVTAFNYSHSPLTLPPSPSVYCGFCDCASFVFRFNISSPCETAVAVNKESPSHRHLLLIHSFKNKQIPHLEARGQSGAAFMEQMMFRASFGTLTNVASNNNLLDKRQQSNW